MHPVQYVVTTFQFTEKYARKYKKFGRNAGMQVEMRYDGKYLISKWDNV